MSGPETVIFAQVNHFRYFRKKSVLTRFIWKAGIPMEDRLIVRGFTEQSIQGKILDDDSDPNPSRVTLDYKNSPSEYNN